MNLLLFEPHEVNRDNTVSLCDRRSVHIIKVLGCGPGDTVRAGIINGPLGTAEIVSVEDSGRETEVTLCFSAGDDRLKLPGIDLIMGLIRPIMLKRVLAQVSSMGVGRIFLINSNRVEKSFWSAGILGDDNYRPYLVKGLEQARDTRLPIITLHKRFRPFIEDIVPEIAGNYDRMLVAHPDSGMNVKEAFVSGTGGRILLAVGPEGGWIDFEIEKFMAQSFTAISMGPRILRTDTAVVALLAQLSLLKENGGNML
jgi:RsmE family RNA methyltransferase